MKKYIIIFVIFFSLNSFAQEGFYLLTTMSGDSVGDQFSVVSHIGDVNADGYDDVIVGAPGGDYAKLFFGSAVFDTIPDLIFRDYKQFNCRFGCSIAGDGDVNGDGYPDIIIGASDTWIGPSCPYECMTTGAAYVYFGGPGIDTTADLTLIVGSWEDQTGWYYEFGQSVAIIGDVNGDGYDDFAVGAPNDDYDAHGRVYIYFGGPSVDEQYDVLLEGEDRFDNFGQSISGAGDINKDGFDDLLIGAPHMHVNPNNPYQYPGKAYLVYGGDEINLANSEVFTGDSLVLNYGRVVAGLGDVNKNGYPDFGIMADEYFKIFSGNNFNPILSRYPSRGVGFIGSLYDLNQDGFDDFVCVSDSVGIYLGKTFLDSMPEFMFSWATPVCYLRNVNGDHHLDIAFAVGGSWDTRGKVYIYSLDSPDEVKENRDQNISRQIMLYQNYPNPFNSSTIIRYSIPKQEQVTLKIYDQLGRLVTTLVNGKQNAGEHQVEFHTDELSSGVYIYKIQSGDFMSSKKMLLLK